MYYFFFVSLLVIMFYENYTLNRAIDHNKLDNVCHGLWCFSVYITTVLKTENIG
jgi:hypothetical protein